MSYEFYFKHNIHAFEWKIKAMVHKNRNLGNELDRICRHPLVRKIYHVPILNNHVPILNMQY